MTSIVKMSETPSIPFYNGRKKDTKEKLESIQAWIKSSEIKWSFVYVDGRKDIFSLCGIEENVDKNRLILISLLELLEWINDPEKKKILLVYTNSLYVVNCVSEWMDKWKRFDFKFDDETDRPNADILRKIDVLKSNIDLTVKLLMTEDGLSNLATSLTV